MILMTTVKLKKFQLSQFNTITYFRLITVIVLVNNRRIDSVQTYSRDPIQILSNLKIINC